MGCSLGVVEADRLAADKAADIVAAARIAAADDKAGKPVGTEGSEEHAAVLKPADKAAGLDEEDVLPAVAAVSLDPWWRMLTVWWQERN